MASELYPCFSYVETVDARIHNPLKGEKGGEDK